MTTLRAASTNMLLHAHKTPGDTRTLLLTYELVDENGDPYVDENGDPYVTLDYASVPVLYVQATDTLLHAGE